MSAAFPHINQEMNERRYSRKHIDGYIREAMQKHPVMQEVVQDGVKLVREYIDKAVAGEYYDYKNARVIQLQNMDLTILVEDIFVGTAYCLKDELFTSVSAQMASRLRFSDKEEAIATTAELLAVLCNTNVFDIRKQGKYGSMTVLSNLKLDQAILDKMDTGMYLPPMVCKPEILTSNYQSPYLTHNDSVILGSNNHHDFDVCLDVLNIMNSVELSLDLDFLCKVEEEHVKEFENQDDRDNWNTFKRQSYQVYSLLERDGNVFHMGHKYDKRGRVYASGYHVTTQGSGFKKAMLEFAQQELVEGVPCL